MRALENAARDHHLREATILAATVASRNHAAPGHTFSHGDDMHAFVWALGLTLIGAVLNPLIERLLDKILPPKR